MPGFCTKAAPYGFLIQVSQGSLPMGKRMRVAISSSEGQPISTYHPAITQENVGTVPTSLWDI